MACCWAVSWSWSWAICSSLARNWLSRSPSSCRNSATCRSTSSCRATRDGGVRVGVRIEDVLKGLARSGNKAAKVHDVPLLSGDRAQLFLTRDDRVLRVVVLASAFVLVLAVAFRVVLRAVAGLALVAAVVFVARVVFFRVAGTGLAGLAYRCGPGRSCLGFACLAVPVTAAALWPAPQRSPTSPHCQDTAFELARRPLDNRTPPAVSPSRPIRPMIPASGPVSLPHGLSAERPAVSAALSPWPAGAWRSQRPSHARCDDSRSIAPGLHATDA